MSRTSAAEIATDLADLIHRSRYLPGDRLPTEAALVKTYGVSRPTVRKALTSLLTAGLLTSQQGSGWYVARDERERFPLDTFYTGMTTATDDVWHRWIRSTGRAAGHHLDVHIEEAPREVARLLLIDGPEPLAVARRRIRTIDGEPVMISTGWWPLWLAANTPLSCEGIGDVVDMRNPSPLKYAAQIGWPVLREADEIGSRMPLDAEAEKLGINPGQPLITMHTTSYTREDRPLRCTADLFPAHRFLLTLNRREDSSPAPEIR